MRWYTCWVETPRFCRNRVLLELEMSLGSRAVMVVVGFKQTKCMCWVQVGFTRLYSEIVVIHFQPANAMAHFTKHLLIACSSCTALPARSSGPGIAHFYQGDQGDIKQAE